MSGDGLVPIQLGRAPAVLTPTLSAAMGLCREHGSFGALLDKVASYDLDACASVVLHGLGRTPHVDEAWTLQEVFDAGMVALVPLLIRFIGILANGGRPIPAEEEKPAGPFGG